MRKICLWCCLVLLTTALALPVAAAEVFSITAEQTDIAPGQTVTFTLQVQGKVTCTSIGIIPAYDPQVWEMVEGTCLCEDASLRDFSPEDGGVMLFSQPTALTGDLVQFTLRVKEDAPLGNTTVTGNVAAKKEDSFLTCQVTGAELLLGTDQTTATQETTPETAPETIPETEPETIPETEPEMVLETEPATVPSLIESPEELTDEELGIHTHTYSETWQHTSTEHWRACDCGEITDRGFHRFDQKNICQDCNMPLSPVLSQEAPSQFPWWAVAVALVVLAGGGVAAYLFIRKKKTETPE